MCLRELEGTKTYADDNIIFSEKYLKLPEQVYVGLKQAKLTVNFSDSVTLS